MHFTFCLIKIERGKKKETADRGGGVKGKRSYLPKVTVRMRKRERKLWREVFQASFLCDTLLSPVLRIRNNAHSNLSNKSIWSKLLHYFQYTEAPGELDVAHKVLAVPSQSSLLLESRETGLSAVSFLCCFLWSLRFLWEDIASHALPCWFSVAGPACTTHEATHRHCVQTQYRPHDSTHPLPQAQTSLPTQVRAKDPGDSCRHQRRAVGQGCFQTFAFSPVRN